jgi:hypothetical protein
MSKKKLTLKDIASAQLYTAGIAKDVKEANQMMKRFTRTFGDRK